ncbi:MAG: Txe/YoeB family addiction module toxin [Tannerellaceae bacterium]|jgi:toxin YoeB|nr:Txe/YoeB family addiction module toxin [Tannerellaceae bacterium]
MYRLVFTEDAKKGLSLLQKKTPTAIKKLNVLLNEIREHPRRGTGRIKQLKHYGEETWSRRINHEHRIVYRVYEEGGEVVILSVYGHYEV